MSVLIIFPFPSQFTCLENSRHVEGNLSSLKVATYLKKLCCLKNFVYHFDIMKME